MNLEGRTILVTGGASGVGLAVAITAHRLGAEVIIGSRTSSRYTEAAASAGADRVHPFIADLADTASLDSALEDLERSGLVPTDVVHCAAGGLEPFVRPMLRAAVALRHIAMGPERDEAIAHYKMEFQRQVTEQSAPAFAVNDLGPRHLLTRLAPRLPVGSRVITFSSLWSEARGRGDCPGFYSSVADSKNHFEEWLAAQSSVWAPRIATAVIVGHLISDTTMGRLIDRDLLPLIPPDIAARLRAGFVTTGETATATIGVLSGRLEPGELRRYYLIGSETLTSEPDPAFTAVVGRIPL